MLRNASLISFALLLLIAVSCIAGRPAPRAVGVRISIFDVRGRPVLDLIDAKQEAGTYQVNRNGRNARGEPVSSGVYLYRVTADNWTETRKMILLR